MKISFNWLKDFIDTNLDVEEVADILTFSGLEVEGVDKVESIKGGLHGLLVGKVLEVQKHPNADKLKLTRVNVGVGEPIPIVCGAPNVAVGQTVIVATVGTIVHPTNGEPFQIQKAKIRGEVSQGMICGEDEIGLGTSHDGILVLDDQHSAGKLVNEIYEVRTDHAIEIGLTPNRADGFSHFGVARDLAAVLNLKEETKTKKIKIKEPSFSGENTLKVSLEDSDKCKRYAGLEITGISVSESPEWLKDRLQTIGLSPINNVVDITNYVLHELGQPLHAFDADQIAGGHVIVRKAKRGEKFVTLDEKERELDVEDLMICDEKEGMCIGGVFGGIKSGVTEKTKNVFLESAYFDPVSIRKSAKRHQLNTDASFRFERGVDPEKTLVALKRAAALIQELAGGELVGEIIDIYPNQLEGFEVDYPFEYAKKLIGKDIPKETVKKILESLDIELRAESAQMFKLYVPPYRVDVQRPADVVEEVLRIYGYNNIELPAQMKVALVHSDELDADKYQNGVADLLSAKGFTEIMSNSLTRSAYAENIKKETFVPILNPLSNELDIMRQSLIFNGLEAIVHNQNRQREDLALFEFGKTYFKTESGYDESKQVALFATGRQQPENWANGNDLQFEGTITDISQSIFKKLGIFKKYKLEASQHPLLSNATSIKLSKKDVGVVGVLDTKTQKDLDINKPVYIAVLNWDVMLSMVDPRGISFRDIPKFPEVRRDFSLLLDKSVSFSDIQKIAAQKGGHLLQDVDLFDVYEGKNLPEGKRSYAVKFIWLDRKSTLKDDIVDGLMEDIRKALEKDLGAVLR
ncbi:MAG: phenylalanine--tRNA ligase subunit beta [Flavobacteriales bacterium]|nr:phenylalanine--tRNA ligase subunit beta [Flavobacteriales bacterium]